MSLKSTTRDCSHHFQLSSAFTMHGGTGPQLSNNYVTRFFGFILLLYNWLDPRASVKLGMASIHIQTTMPPIKA